MAETRNVDVAVVGAGPAGIAAACRAAEAGARVLVLDENPGAGGQIWRGPAAGAPAEARRWLERFARCGADLSTETRVVEGRAGFLLAERGQEPLRIRAGKIVLATGARELFLPFPGWTLPGVLGVGGAQALVKGGASVRGRRAIVAGSGPLLLPAAAALRRAGARVLAVCEQAPRFEVRRFVRALLAHPGRLREALGYRLAFPLARYRLGTWVAGARGARAVEEALLTDGARMWTVDCDLLACSYGLVPATELARLIGCDVVHGKVIAGDDQETTVPGVYCAGEPTGIGGAERALLEGQIAGLAAVGRAAEADELRRGRDRLEPFVQALGDVFTPRSELRQVPDATTLVCRCEDVRFGRLCGQAGPRAAKLATRVGMGACQGRVCGAALQVLMGWQIDTVRSPVEPATLATLAASGEEEA
ncbi:MAG: FAD-dependent oxidoreductase [Acidobacteriota bacterium]